MKKSALIAAALASTLAMQGDVVPDYMTRERVGAPGAAQRKAKRKAQKKARKKK